MNSAQPTQPPIISDHVKPRRRWPIWILGAVGIILAIVLFAFDPTQSTFYPVCMFKKATGWSCPACGCLRATHQLLHGHFGAAFRLNALFIVSLGVVALLTVQEICHKRIIKNPALVGWMLLALFVVFGILRNLPPFLAWSGQ